MNERMQIPAKPTSAPARHLASEPSGILRRKCGCGGSGGSSGECAECQKTKLQRPAAGSGPETVPPILHDVLRSPGQPLDAQTRAFFEPRFGHDFSSVRIHGDGEVAQLAQTGSGPAGSRFVRDDGPIPRLFDGIKEVETGHTDCNWDRSVKNDEPFIPKSGDPKVNIRTEDPCIRDCTVQHEGVHVNQLKPLCKQYYDCYTSAPAQAATSDDCKGFTGDELKKCQSLATQLRRLDCFITVASAWEAQKWECEAYKTSLSCAVGLLPKAKPECRPKIEEYRDSAKKQIEKYCKTVREENDKKPNAGGKQVPPAQPKQEIENRSGLP